MVHLAHVLSQNLESIWFRLPFSQFSEGGLEQVHISVDLLFLSLVKALALIAGLVGDSVGDIGEEGGHAGEVAAGFPVLPADLAEGEAGCVVEGEQKETTAMFLQETPVWVVTPHLALFLDASLFSRRSWRDIFLFSGGLILCG